MTVLFKNQSRKIGLVAGTLVHVGEERTARVRVVIIDYKDELFQERELVKIVRPFIS